jgi:multiple sugar transport system permease protein
MQSQKAMTALPAQRKVRSGRISQLLDHEVSLGWLMVTPLLLLLILMIAYPFAYSVYLSFTDTRIAQEDTGNIIGLDNYETLWDRNVFRDNVIFNTLIYTVGAVPIKLVLGMMLALILNRRFPLRNVVRGLILLPWVIPTSISMIVFRWMFEPTQSVLNHVLESMNFPGAPFSWLGVDYALPSVMAVNIWRGTPFFAIVLLAALQVVPQDQMEAAEIDGANVIQRFMRITIPAIMPVVIVATLFSIVRTFAEMEIVWVLTRGGPFNETHMVGTYAYQQAIQNNKIGEGAAISMFFFPAMLAIISLQLWYLRRRDS